MIIWKTLWLTHWIYKKFNSMFCTIRLASNLDFLSSMKVVNSSKQTRFVKNKQIYWHPHVSHSTTLNSHIGVFNPKKKKAYNISIISLFTDMETENQKRKLLHCIAIQSDRANWYWNLGPNHLSWLATGIFLKLPVSNTETQ